MALVKNILFPLVLCALIATSCSSPQTPVDKKMDAEAFHKKIENTEGEVILDVRTPEEYGEGHLPGAININFNAGDFEAQISKLDTTKLYMVYCKSGRRSASAVELMQSKGFDKTIELENGIMGWREANLPEEGGGKQQMSLESYHELTKSAPLVVVDFYAEWCVPCKKMEPMLKELEAENSENLKLVRIDVEANRNLSSTLEIAAIPVIKVFKNGREKAVFNGLTSKEDLLAVF